MINFPKWVQGKKSDAASAIAARRLRYLVLRASVELTCKGSVTSLGQFAGVENGTMHWSIHNGCFSIASAKKLEEACGRDLVRKEWLIYPLDIASE